jgi:hypothetical protein
MSTQQEIEAFFANERAYRSRAAMWQQQLKCARQLPDDEVKRHAAIATDNGLRIPDDESFTSACEVVRRERGLPPLHDEE